MKKYFINEAKCGVTDGGIACGPVSGNVVASVKYSDGETTKWITNVEVTGIPNFYVTDDDIYDKCILEDMDDVEFTDYLQDVFVNEFEGIDLGEYDDIIDSINENSENPAVPLLKYLIALTRCEMDQVEELVAAVVGHNIDDVYLSDGEEEDVDDYVSCFIEIDKKQSLEVGCSIEGIPEKGIKVLSMHAGEGNGYYTMIYTYNVEMCIDDNGEKKYLLCSYCEGGFQFEVLPESVIEGLVYEEGFKDTVDRISEMRTDDTIFTEIEMTKDSRYHDLFKYMYDYIRNEIELEDDFEVSDEEEQYNEDE